MKRAARIRIAGRDFGLYPQSLSLNPRFRADVPRIKLDVEIDWKPRHPGRALAALEEALLEICPSLERHQCRGQIQYHILRGLEEPREAPDDGAGDIETPLALAHLLEHVLIDTIAYVTGEKLLSGATGARRDSRQRFDIFVECPDAAVAQLAVELSVAWMKALLNGKAPDGAGRPALELAHHAYKGKARGLDLSKFAGHLAKRELSNALKWLEKNGFVRREGTLVFYVPGR